MKDYSLRVLLQALNSETISFKMQSENAKKFIKCTETDKMDLSCY